MYGYACKLITYVAKKMACNMQTIFEGNFISTNFL
jgi:hypothetical protein